MSGGHEQAFEVGWPQDRKMVRGVGSQASPGFLDACILQSGSQLDGCGKNLLDAARGDALVETDVLHRAGSRIEGCTHRSEEHTSELQSQSNLVCRLLLEKKIMK